MTNTTIQDQHDIGERLKFVRTRAGLSQRELAKRASVTNAAISLIEKNQNSPSVASLKKILEAIPMTLADFFSEESEMADQIFFKADELIPITNGAVCFRQVGRVQNRQLQVLYERYAPGADTGKSMLKHQSEEGGIVMAGQIELTVGERKQVLCAGDAYLFNSNEPHRFRNIGTEECVIVSACTPPYL